MADIFRIKTIWSGMPGAPGVTTMYLKSSPSAAHLTGVKNFWTALAAGLPNTLTLSIPGTGDIVDDATGDLTGTWTATAPASVAGSSASGYSAPSGTLLHWATSGVVAGRRVRGTTFIVPTVNQYEANGTVVASWITTATAAGTALISAFAGEFIVWARPFTPSVGHPGTARAGSQWVVVGNSMPDKAIVLRSRRD